MRLKQITFILENCDSITIDGKYIGDFLIDDIHKSIERVACNAIEEINKANTIAIEIHKDANKDYYQFAGYFQENLDANIKSNIKEESCEVNRVNNSIESLQNSSSNPVDFRQTDLEDLKHKTFDRLLNCPDITSIEFELVNNYEGSFKYDTYNYWVNWTGDDDYTNESQKTYLSKNDNLYLIIAENKEISDFFNLDEINDSEYMDYKFMMFDVGDKSNSK